MQKCFSNYRPISILPAISKIFEKALFKQIYTHFEKNNLFYEGQYGFREKHSTELAAIETIEHIYDTLNRKKEIPIALFMDLSKAFDTLDHNILIWKLKQYGICKNALILIQSYLEN